MCRMPSNDPDARWVRENRLKLGLHQHQLASLINVPNGINPGRISEIETGHKPNRPEWREQMRHIFAQGA